MQIAFENARSRWFKLYISVCISHSVILGQYVCHVQDNTFLEAAVLVSSLFDLGDNIKQLENHPTNILFSRYLACELIKELKP